MEGGLVEQDPGAGLQGQGVVASFRPCRHWGSISREGFYSAKKKMFVFWVGLSICQISSAQIRATQMQVVGCGYAMDFLGGTWHDVGP